MDWAGFRFQDPAWLWVALAGPLVLAGRAGSASATRRRGRSPSPGPSRLRRVRPGLARPRCATRRSSSRALGLVAGAVALARPQHGIAARERDHPGRRHRRGPRRVGVDGGRGLPAAEPARGGQGGGGRVREAPHRPTAWASWSFAGRSLTKSPPTTDTAVLLRQLDDVAPRDAARRHRDRLRPRHRAHAAAPLAGEEPGDRAGHRRRQQRGRDRPRHRRRHGQGHGGARLHDPGGPGRPGADAGARPRPVHRPGGAAAR